jgi:6-phosphofructokinase 2
MHKILTITPNPAVDLSYALPHLVSFHKMRTGPLVEDPGGGGINVARVLKSLGARVEAVTMLGGPIGQLLARLLNQSGVKWRAVHIAGETRLSINLHTTDEAGEYRLVPEGPQVTPHEWDALLDLIDAEAGDWLVASGSLPPGVPDDAYAGLAARAHAHGHRIGIDTSGRALMALRGQKIDVLKLSESELATLAGQTDIETAARLLIADGTAERVAVTLGERGALLASTAGICRAPAIAVEIKSTVGAGDSFLAGLIDALSRGLDDAAALRWANATAAAAVSQEGTAHVDKAHVEALAARCN